MHSAKIQHGFALVAAFGLAASTVRAEMITPDSIPNPPASVNSANGTSVALGNLVNTQYKGLGLNFTSGAAITNLNGVSVWAPTEMLAQPASRVAGGPPVNYPSAQISYYGVWSGAHFVEPGTLRAAVATSLSLDIIGRQNIGIWVTYAHTTTPVGRPASIEVASAPNGGVVYTIPAIPGITSFSIFAPVPVDPPMSGNPEWGVAGVSFTLASAPEPSSLILAGLGVLGLAARFGWRRTRRALVPGC